MLIIHGDNYSLSRQAWVDEKAKYPDALIIDGSNLNFSDLSKYLHTTSLFGSQRTLFVENLFSRRPSVEKNKILDYFSGFSPPPEIIFYDPKDVTASLKAFPPSIIRKFDWPKYLYQFLDSFSLPSLRLTLGQMPPEVVLASLAKQLHNLLLLKHGSADLPAWQAGKLKPLANRFFLPQLISMQKQLLNIDYRSKNSLLTADLGTALVDWCIKNVLLT